MTRIETLQTFFNGVFVALLEMGKEDCKDTLLQAYNITHNHYKTQPIFRGLLPNLLDWVNHL